MMTTKPLTYGQLPQLSDSREVKQSDGSVVHILNNNPFLYCDECGAEYSANRGDYWQVPDANPIVCHDPDHDPQPMRLVKRVTAVVDVEVDEP